MVAVTVVLAAGMGAQAWAQSPAHASLAVSPPQNVFRLSAAGQVEVVQDMLTLSLTATREGADASNVQAELRKALDTALTEVKKTAQDGDMEVRTGTFSVNPRYGKEGKITAWAGRAELLLEGKDFPRITQAAARATSMTIGNVYFGLSREQRARVQTQAQAEAIERFKARASEITKAFGFASYGLREVTVDGGEAGVPRPMAMEARAFTRRLPILRPCRSNRVRPSCRSTFRVLCKRSKHRSLHAACTVFQPACWHSLGIRFPGPPAWPPNCRWSGYLGSWPVLRATAPFDLGCGEGRRFFQS